ncbi:MAG: zinc ribbon domain-containing protein [Gammaproteobacteria bacterium]|nr:zinc ribbon domain-containing protein [Gammaproteobacteria bacterium]
MPSYDYHCPANDRTVEAKHRMSETISTWGELCENAGIDPGNTDLKSPVEKVFTCCQVSTRSATPELPCGRSKCACH